MMSDNEQKFIADLAEQLEVDRTELHQGFPLSGSDWDSVLVLSTVALIDEHFNITVPGEELENCQTIGEVMALIQKGESG
jgi:acyl carrier protein